MAWETEKNGSGIAIGALKGNVLELNDISTSVIGLENIIELLAAHRDLSGVAIDAPLIIKNRQGARPCESELNEVYRSKWAGCYPCNLTRYPNAASVRLSKRLLQEGMEHLGDPATSKWQVECYPHPALIELFGLRKRLKYKKGTPAEQRAGQTMLAQYLLGLNRSSVLTLKIPQALLRFFDRHEITRLSGSKLKANEDALDAVVCLCVAGLYALGDQVRVFGSKETGYIVVPQGTGI